MVAVRNALQAQPFPLRLRPFRSLPRLLWKPDALHFPFGHSPLLLRGVTTRGMWRVSFAWFLVRSPFPPPSVRWKGRGGAVALASAGAGNSAASSLPGVGVARSSRSQESLVLADPDPVASSSPPGGDHRSCSGGRGSSTGDRSHSSRLSSPRGRASREERRCARSRSRGAHAWSRESRSRSMDRSLSCGRKRSRRDLSRSPSACVRSRRSRLRSSDHYRDRRVRLRFRSDRSLSRQLRS